GGIEPRAHLPEDDPGRAGRFGAAQAGTGGGLRVRHRLLQCNRRRRTIRGALSRRVRSTAWGIAVEEKTLATNLPGVFAGGDAVLGADLAVRAVAAGRIAAASIHQYLTGQAVTGEPAMAGIAMQPVDDAERAAIFRAIESAARVRNPEIS